MIQSKGAYIMMGFSSWNHDISDGWCMKAMPTHKATHHLDRLARFTKDLFMTWLTRRLKGISRHCSSTTDGGNAHPMNHMTQT